MLWLKYLWNLAIMGLGPYFACSFNYKVNLQRDLLESGRMFCFGVFCLGNVTSARIILLPP